MICIVKTLAISKLANNVSILTALFNFSKEVKESCFKFISLFFS